MHGGGGWHRHALYNEKVYVLRSTPAACDIHACMSRPGLWPISGTRLCSTGDLQEPFGVAFCANPQTFKVRASPQRFQGSSCLSSLVPEWLIAFVEEVRAMLPKKPSPQTPAHPQALSFKQATCTSCDLNPPAPDPKLLLFKLAKAKTRSRKVNKSTAISAVTSMSSKEGFRI